MAIGDQQQNNLFKEIMTYEEMQLVQTIFLDVFDNLSFSYYAEGDAAEISDHLAMLYTTLRQFKLLVPQTVEYFNESIFRNPLLTDFHLEFNDRLCAEITPMGKNAYKRLINTLVVGTVEAKAESSKITRSIDPVLMSVAVKNEDAHRSYLENPWLVGLTLLTRWFKKTTLGTNVSSTLKNQLKR